MEKETIINNKDYITYFEDNFLISQISNYHNKLSEQIKSAKK